MEEELTFNDQIELEHLLFSERKCRVCGKVKNLVDDFYLTRKYKGRKIKSITEDIYPDW